MNGVCEPFVFRLSRRLNHAFAWLVGVSVLALGAPAFGCSEAGESSVRETAELPAGQEAEPRDAGSERPNVLFISIDDLRPELGCYGASQAQTPAMDSVARGGMRFDNAYCQYALCSPSRVSLLTGARPATTRIFGQKELFRDTLPDIVTLPQYFKANGYRTVSMGKVFHGKRLDPASWSEPEYLPDRKLIYANPENQAINTPRTKGPVTEAEDVPDEGYRDGSIAARALETLERVKDEPFFMALGFFKPHLPFAAPKRYWDQYPLESIELPENMDAPLGAVKFGLHNSAEVRSYLDAPDEAPFSDAFMKRLLRGYLASTTYVDTQIGKVLAKLDELGLADNTIVVLYGDHGFYLGDHGMWGKTGTFESVARVPLVVRYPGHIEAGSATSRLVELVDLYPTLCELAGLEAPEHLEGTSFVPLIADPERAWKKAAFTYHTIGPVEGRSIRTERYRFTSWRTVGRKAREIGYGLYDHRADPGEHVNLFGKPEHTATADALRERLDAGWRAAVP